MPTKSKTKKRSAVAKGRRKSVKAPEYVSGIYADLEQTRAGVDDLIAYGFSESDLAAALIATVRVEDLRNQERNDTAVMPNADREVGMTARTAGSVLALSSMPLVAPILLAAPLLGPIFGWKSAGMLRKNQSARAAAHRMTITVKCEDPRAAKSAAEILERTGATNLGMGQLRRTAEEELKSREYRDDLGETHHHTHTYMQDHPEELLA